MTRHPYRLQAMAIALAALAGFVDALGFVHLGGVFISFMTGNSTRLAAGAAGVAAGGTFAAAVIALFVAGVMLGTLLARWSGGRSALWVLGLVTFLLTAGAAAHQYRLDMAAIVAATLAMGAINLVLQRDGEVSVGITYMTGTLVKLGQRAADALLGGARWAWLPHGLLWSGHIAGAAGGAFAYAAVGLGALWGAAGAAALLAVPIALIVRRAD